MANLKPADVVEDPARSSRHSDWGLERAGVLDDILHRTIGELAGTRVELKRMREEAIAESNKLNRAHWNERRLVEHLKASIDMIHDDHLKRRPRHKKSPSAAAHHGCKACQLLLRIEKDVQDFGKELAR